MQKLEKKILHLLSNQLLSIRQVARILKIKRHIASQILEKLKNEGKLELFKVGKAYVYTISKQKYLKKSLKKRTKKRIEKYKLREKELPEIIGIASGKGGVGKTTVAINLAYIFQKLGKEVIVFDGDVRACGVGLYLGEYNFPATLIDFLNGKVDLKDVIQISSELKFLPSALVTKKVNFKKISEIFKHPFLKDKLILVDYAPGLEKNVTELIKVCNKLLIVTTPDLPSLANAVKLYETAKMQGINVLGIIVNRRKKRCKTQMTSAEMEKILDAPILGTIPEDENIPRSMFYHSPVARLYPFSPSSIEFSRIAHHLLGFEYKSPSKLKILFKSIIGRFK